MEKLAARTKKMVAGDPLDPKTRYGALASKKQLETVQRYVDTAKKEGASLRRRRRPGRHRHRQGLLLPADGIRPTSRPR